MLELKVYATMLSLFSFLKLSLVNILASDLMNESLTGGKRQERKGKGNGRMSKANVRKEAAFGSPRSCLEATVQVPGAWETSVENLCRGLSSAHGTSGRSVSLNQLHS